ncbi:hypothetical protein [Nitrososphaeria virus YSH_462411]|uniref:Uncharacterized protein n=1 Tax=Nitrososphaeria virus YSH_462411 TaxID=3071321 RepID=A0A976YF54_9CAUD|nr:hypothetical protein QKV92_gp50 [Yangshan Harbor Nitrososphaeria virus]UVF62322.1 hypothetical protein [Nitrososphaeria virus YSH_462411]
MGKLQWVSEWHIEPEESEYFKFKITNNGVYTSAKTIQEAERILNENIEWEKRQYHINLLRCPNCNKPYLEHGGLVEYRNCLIQLSLDGRFTKYE